MQNRQEAEATADKPHRGEHSVNVRALARHWKRHNERLGRLATVGIRKTKRRNRHADQHWTASRPSPTASPRPIIGLDLDILAATWDDALGGCHVQRSQCT